MRPFPHPRDPGVLLSAERRPFGPWRLRVNGELVGGADPAATTLTLASGESSTIAATSRGLDPFPVFVIDGERYPTGQSLGVLGVVSVLLPLVGLLAGFPGTFVGVVGSLVTLWLARTSGLFLLRATSGIGFMVLAIGTGVAVYQLYGPGQATHVRSVDWRPLPAVPGSTPGAVARTALERLPVSPTVDTLPASTAEIPPVTLAEIQQLRTWIVQGDFSEAGQMLRGSAQEARADVRRETRWRTLYRMGFQAQSDTFAAALDDWVAIDPDAAEPLAARAWNRYWIAYYWRGEGLGPRTPEALTGFRNALSNAAEDAVAALRRDPDQLPALWVLINTARTEGDHATVRALLTRALARSPTSFESYAMAMIASYPVWGGSLEEMQQLADEALAGAARNPDLGRLAGYVDWMRARSAQESRKGEGLASARQALRAGRDPLFYETLGHVLLHAGEPAAGLAYLDTALALEPTFDEAYSTRRKIYNALMYANSGPRASMYEGLYESDLRTELMLRPLMEP